jgi:hypothetical protein
MKNKRIDARNGGARNATEGLTRNVHAVSAALLLLLTPTQSRGDDFGDTIAGSAAITAESTKGVLDSETDQDWFKFEVTVPGLHTIYTTGSTDTLGALYRSSGEVISSGISQNDQGSGRNFEYDTILGGGTYHLKVTTGGRGNLTGAYSLEIRHPQRAKSLQLANTNDQLEVIGDRDFYRIQVSEAGRHWFSTVGKVDTFGALFSEAGQQLVSGIPGNERGEGNNFRFSVKLNPGTYYLRINSGDRGIKTGSYTISWRHKGNAIPFSGPNREISLGVLGDLDYYEIHLLQNSSYRLYSTGDTDTFATLYDDAGNELISGVSGDDRGAGRNFLIDSRSQAGTYYLMVEDGGEGNLTGHYGLHLRDRARSIPLLESGTSQHEISLAGEIDLYSFASPGGAARFESTGLTDTYAELLTESGERLAGGVSGQDRGEQNNFAFETTLPAGNFLLLVRGQDRSLDVGSYGLIDSGGVVGNLATGFHLIECKPIPGRRTPAPVSAEVRANLVSEAILTYFQSGDATGTPAEVLPYDLAAINSSAAAVGQIRSSVGSGTGFAVSERVVATAGHVVFDDSTLSFVPDLEWLFQRDADVHEPVPQAAKGVHLMTGYAARRAVEKTPGTASPESQSLDVAAVYFNEDIGRGARSGYLASDLAVNEYLTSASLKTLVGYPVEGIPGAARGRLHATPPQKVSFTAAGDRTYSTIDILGVGGLSGAPLCVARENGTFYPAGIYLGGDGRAVVRAIDSAITALFRQARISATGGGNNTGGGITLSTVVSFGEDEAAPGAVKIIIEPAAARDAGAAWALGAEGFVRTSGNQRNGLDGGVYDLKLKEVPGFLAPTAQIMQVSNNQLTTVTFTYAPLFNAQETWRMDNFGSAENTGPGADEADPDADGASNRAEYIAGTDPKDPSDLLRILTGSKRDATTYIATVVGKADRTYRLAKFSIASRTWQTITNRGPLTADTVIELEDSSASSQQGIYQVVVSFSDDD